MSQQKPYAFGPLALTTSVTNLVSPGTTTGGVNTTGTPYGNLRVRLHRIRVVNTTSSPVSVSLFLGASDAVAAGTEFEWSAASVPAYGNLECWPYGRPLDVGTYLTAVASASGLTIEGSGEIGVA